MAVSETISKAPITRRRFLIASACAGGGLALYGSEIERHWIEITHRDAFLPGLPQAFDGFRFAQLSDIHIDEYTEPFFLREAIHQINKMNPDAVFLTGDFVTHGLLPKKLAIASAWQCANLLNRLKCPHRYAILGNHDVMTSPEDVTEALTANAITVLDNAHVPIERAGARFWLAGVDDPVEGEPDPDLAIPQSIRNIAHEPIVLLCHAPDYVDDLLITPVGQAPSLMLSGHTHGGQVRMPFVGATILPPLGHKYVEGWFRFGNLQLYVNRGLGTVGIPVRFDCPPEITLFTLRTA
jgi:predicted MPP superfamily phosphohydrolase